MNEMAMHDSHLPTSLITHIKVIGALLNPSGTGRRVVEENGGVLLTNHLDVVWPRDKFVGMDRVYMIDLMSRVEMMIVAIDESCTF